MTRTDWPNSGRYKVVQVYVDGIPCLAFGNFQDPYPAIMDSFLSRIGMGDYQMPEPNGHYPIHVNGSVTVPGMGTANINDKDGTVLCSPLYQDGRRMHPLDVGHIEGLHAVEREWAIQLRKE